ncbi:MAG: DUF885 domain-containing protein [Acidimicrobiia bacterium]
MPNVFEIADRYVDELCELHPLLATSLGVPGHDHEWGNVFSLEGVEALADLARRLREGLTPHLAAADPRQRRAARVIVASLDEQLSGHEAGDHFRDLRHLGSSFHRIRSIFDLMPADTIEDWENITRRLETIDRPYADYRELLAEGVRRGIVVAQRQVRSIVEQASQLGGEQSAFNTILKRANGAGQLTDRLQRAVDHARAAAGEFGRWLEASYLPHASGEDAVGEEYYRRQADRLVGLAVEPDDAYRWGWEEFGRLLAEMERVGDRILPGATVLAVKEHLETDPSGLARSTDELKAFVTEVLARAVEALAGTHFEVPDAIRPLTVNIAPPGGPLSVYYMGPSEDLSRPGGVWYSLGDQQVFPLYQHVSTAYHEGFPGHHLQVATAKYHRDDLSRIQRNLIWYPGYGEGWAMYAEVLMGELGFLENPRHYFGMLAKQMYRAVRVVVDTGLHLGKTIPESSPIGSGSVWDFDTAVEFMRVYGFRTRAQAEAEVLRYLGWPGQAISYKLGERELLEIRAETKARLGPAFDLKAFHQAILNGGSMRMDTLRHMVQERLG